MARLVYIKLAGATLLVGAATTHCRSSQSQSGVQDIRLAEAGKPALLLYEDKAAGLVQFMICQHSTDNFNQRDFDGTPIDLHTVCSQKKFEPLKTVDYFALLSDGLKVVDVTTETNRRQRYQNDIEILNTQIKDLDANQGPGAGATRYGPTLAAIQAAQATADADISKQTALRARFGVVKNGLEVANVTLVIPSDAALDAMLPFTRRQEVQVEQEQQRLQALDNARNASDAQLLQVENSLTGQLTQLSAQMSDGLDKFLRAALADQNPAAQPVIDSINTVLASKQTAIDAALASKMAIINAAKDNSEFNVDDHTKAAQAYTSALSANAKAQAQTAISSLKTQWFTVPGAGGVSWADAFNGCQAHGAGWRMVDQVALSSLLTSGGAAAVNAILTQANVQAVWTSKIISDPKASLAPTFALGSNTADISNFWGASDIVALDGTAQAINISLAQASKSLAASPVTEVGICVNTGDGTPQAAAPTICRGIDKTGYGNQGSKEYVKLVTAEGTTVDDAKLALTQKCPQCTFDACLAITQ